MKFGGFGRLYCVRCKVDIYKSVPAAHLKRSMFHWKTERNQTQDWAAIVPFFIREGLPGDIWKLNLSTFIRVQPMVAAPFTPMRFYAQFWFCPTRVLMQKLYPEIVDAWATFIFGGPNGDGKNEAGQTPTLPLWVPNASNVKLAGIDVSGGVQSRKTGNADAVGSLWDYCGLPVNQGYHGLDNDGVDANNQDFSAWLPLAFPKIMYNLIWNEFFRNENLEASVDLMSDDVQLTKWKHDYFTSSLPFQQRGAPVALPITGIGGISFNDPLSVSVGKVNVGVEWPSDPSVQNPVSLNFAGGTVVPAGIQVNGIAQPAGNYVLKAWSSTATSTPEQLEATNPVVDFSQASTFTVSDMRLAFQTQKWLERAARGGVRYIEGLKSFFGTSPNNDALQLPVFIGGMKQNIIVNEVLQNSETTNSSPQGNIAGRGISAGGDNIGTFHCREHGWIMGLCWIRPDLYYMSQGIHRELLRRSKYDYYWPQFAHLSERPIYKAELFASPSSMTPAQMGAGSEGLFGYTGMYNEYRSSHNEIAGEMRSTFDYWHVARKFTSAPELGADFITCFPRKDIFAVQDEDEFLLDILTDVKVYRPMPVESNPGLIDHF